MEHRAPGSKLSSNCKKCTNADVRLGNPDDGQKGCPKHVRVVIPIKLESSMSLGFIHKGTGISYQLNNAGTSCRCFCP